MKSKLPNFLLVGAAKCGTSSLHNYLNQHSDIFMPTYNKEGMKVKEPRFLIKDLVQNRLPKGVWNWDEYQALFDDVDSEKAIGESTVLYLYFYETAINNIKKYLGDDVKIIIMLRNPVDRAYSAYSFASRTMQENQSFELAIENAFERYSADERLSPMILYKELGNYTDMVKAYKESFSNVHVVLYDDFISNTEKEVLNVFGKLNIVVNNAGCGSQHCGVKPNDPPSLRWEILRSANLDSNFFVSAHSLPYLAKNKDSAIVNISSTATFHGNWGLYGAAKTGVEGMTRSFAVEASCAQNSACSSQPRRTGSRPARRRGR